MPGLVSKSCKTKAKANAWLGTSVAGAEQDRVEGAGQGGGRARWSECMTRTVPGLCSLQQSLGPWSPITQEGLAEARPAESGHLREGAWQGGAGMPFTRPRPRRAQLPARARIMAAAALRQVGARRTGAPASGEADGGTLPDGPLACSLSGLASFLCASGSAAGRRGGRGPVERSAGLFNGRQSGETRVGCGGYLMRGSLAREVGSGEHGGGL